jgi:16S rRNA (uracil1498-N3)-methyltransferase
MAKRFYVNCPLALGHVTVEGPEARHLAAVSRLRPGDPVCLFNGDGHEYSATVIACGRKSVDLELIGQESPYRELPFRMEVAAPLPKGDRGQFLLEKLTELGVTSFVPLRTERSIIHPGESRLERLHRWVIEASKQCGRNVLMRVAPVTAWTDYCRQENLPRTRFFAHPGAAGYPAIESARPNQDLVLAVGPEGGFMDFEVKAAQENNWRPITLGPRILRIETAAVALAARISVGSG